MLPGGIVGVGEGAADLSPRGVVPEGVRCSERPFEGHDGPVQRAVGELGPAQQVPGVQPVLARALLFQDFGGPLQCLCVFRRHEAIGCVVRAGGFQQGFRLPQCAPSAARTGAQQRRGGQEEDGEVILHTAKICNSEAI